MPLWLIPAAILYLALAIARFRWAVFVLIALLPTYLLRFNIGWLPSTWLEVMIWVVILIWAGRLALSFVIPERMNTVIPNLFRDLQIDPETNLGQVLEMLKRVQHDIRKHWPLSLGILLLLIAGTISMFIAPDLRAAAGLWKAYIIEPLALFVVFITTFKKEDAPKIIFALSLTALATSVFAIYQKFTGFGIPNPYWAAEETRRVTSIWGFPNAVGLFLAPLIPLFLWRLFHSHPERSEGSHTAVMRFFGSFRSLRMTYFTLVTLASLLAIISAKSTGALVGLAAALVLTGVLYKKTRIATIALTVLGAILILTVPRLAPVKQELMLQDYSGKLRRDMWAESVEFLSEHPILGTGLSSYKEVIRRYRIDKWIEIFEYPHNIILNFWIELGALGVLAFVLIFYWLFKTILSPLYKGGLGGVSTALLASFIIILVHGLVDVPYFKNDLAVQFWLLAALCYNTLTLTLSQGERKIMKYER